MDVTKKNFREILPQLEADIESANFFTIDSEFTGLSTENNIYPFDRPEDAFRKTNINCDGYILIQFGLTIVKSDLNDKEKFTYKSYNFYVFPNLWKHAFRCQGTSLTFLAENNFDFNKLFLEGISFCSPSEEKQLREKLAERQKEREQPREQQTGEQNSSADHVPVPEEEREAIDRIKTIIEEFILSDEKEKVIQNCNAFQRKLVYQMVEVNFADKITATTRNLLRNLKVIVIERKKSAEEEEIIENERKNDELIELENKIGISVILKKISESRKLIVMHNGLYDLIFILRQFFGPIPENFKEFKRHCHSIFPSIIDTKFMCVNEKFKSLIKSSVLGQLVETLSHEPFTLAALDPECTDHSYSLHDKSERQHQAGYDSYLTAVAFTSLTKFLNISPAYVKNNRPELKSFYNKIFMMRLQDVNYINLVGNEPSPSRDHVFHCALPETWRQSDLVNHFKNFGPIYITWINSTSALISLHNREHSKSVPNHIGSAVGFKLQTFKEFNESLERRLFNPNSDHHSDGVKRKLSESSSLGISDVGSETSDLSNKKLKHGAKTLTPEPETTKNVKNSRFNPSNVWP